MVMKECLYPGFVYQKGSSVFCIPVWEHKTYKWIKNSASVYERGEKS